MPFFIRAGKCLPVTATEVVVELKGPPAFFDVDPEHGNHYRFRLSPEVVIALGTRDQGARPRPGGPTTSS